MPAKSKAQHGLMGMVLAYKRGKSLDSFPAGVRKRIKQMASSMSEKQLEEYTSTKASKLPKHKGSPRKIRKVSSA